jgi:hypothetical protein
VRISPHSGVGGGAANQVQRVTQSNAGSNTERGLHDERSPEGAPWRGSGLQPDRAQDELQRLHEHAVVTDGLERSSQASLSEM